MLAHEIAAFSWRCILNSYRANVALDCKWQVAYDVFPIPTMDEIDLRHHYLGGEKCIMHGRHG